MTCGKCKSEFGDGNFCITCGASREQAQEETKLAVQKRDVREDAINLANKAIASIKDFSSKVAQTFVILVIEPLVGFYKFALRNKARTALFGSVAFLLFGWLISQSLISSLVGPEQTVARYVDAIKTGNFEALNDESLFPGAKMTPEAIQTGWLADRVSSVSAKVLSNKGGSAEVEISNGKEAYSIHLTATGKNYFIFSIPEWQVKESAPLSSVYVAAGIDKAQKITFSDSAEQFAANDLKALGNFNVLPGYYSTKVSGLGFNKQTTTVSSIFLAGNRLINVQSDTIILPFAVSSSASAKAQAAAKACAQSKCSAISKYVDTDFDLWSQFSATGYSYTSSRFDYKLLTPSCQAPTFISTSAFRGELAFNCTGDVKAHLYVRDTYYSGWYSDYYYYWNFYDTSTYSLSVHVKVSTDASGKISLGAVTKN